MIKRSNPLAIFLGFLALVLLTQPSNAAAPSHAETLELQPRLAPTKPATVALTGTARDATIDPQHYAGYVVLKFQEGTQVRLRDGQWTSLPDFDLTAVKAVLADHPELQASRLFHRPERLLEQDRLQGQARSGRQLADLNLYYALPIADAAQALRLADALNELRIVEIAYPEPLGEPAEVLGHQVLGDIGLPTPSFVANQGYLYDAKTHNGIEADHAWTVPGGAGAAMKFIDIELNWRTTHEDLQAATLFYIGGSPFGSSDHGSAVVGEVVADDDEFGVTGIAHQSDYGIQAVDMDQLPSIADSFNQAAAQLDPGDVILIELHWPGPSSGEYCTCNCDQFEYIAMEYWQANFDAIQTASANGVIVVEAGGNGGMNFDNPIFDGAFDRKLRDSGAIVVGAGLSNVGYTPARAPHCWTNYGRRLDVQGWGDSIWTLGYGNGWNEGHVGGDSNDQDQWYMSYFGGTSGASPIVVGAVLSINGMRKAAGLPVLDAWQMRELLGNTGTPQARDHKPIGPLPNLRQAAGGLFHTVSFTDTSGNGNGAPDPGEHMLQLDIGLQTLGVAHYQNVSATLSSALPGLTWLTATQAYSDISPTGGAISRTFVFELDQNVPCGVSLPFTLAVTSDQEPYEATLELLTGRLAGYSLVFNSDDVPKPIPDNSWPGVTSSLALSEALPAGDIDVTLWISHPDVQDLQADLRSPSGVVVELFKDLPISGVNFAGTTFDDEAACSINNAYPPHGDESHRPAGFLADFDGQNTSGVWQLTVRDIQNANKGTLTNWRLTITPRVCVVPASLSASKTGPDVVSPGELLTYTLLIENPGDFPLYSVVVTESYDANTAFYTAEPPPTSGDDLWQFAQIDAHGAQAITIGVRLTETIADHTVLTNTAWFDADEVEPISVSQTTLALYPPVLNIIKTATPDPVGSWQPLTCTLAVSNSGSRAATGIIISDALPLGSSFVGCGGGLCAQNEGVVTWSGLGLPANDELEVTLTISACAGPLVNRAFRVVGSNEGVSSPWGTPITSSVSAPNLVAAWQVSSDTLPINVTLTLTSASSTDGSPIVAWAWDFGDGSTLFTTGGSQASGPVVSHSYTSTGVYTLTLTITDTCGYSATLIAPDAITVYQSSAPPVLSISKTATPDPVGSWQPLTCTLTVSNSGGPASGIVISDALPLGSSFVGCGGGLCVENESVVTWSGLGLPANDELEVTLTISACAGPLLNRAFRVVGSNEDVGSPWGTPITSSVSAPNLVAAWGVSSDTLPINAALTLTSASSTDGSPIVAWAWDFGDGSQASGPVVSHTYSSAGVYTLTLTITDTCGYSATLIAPDAITVYQSSAPPVLSISKTATPDPVGSWQPLTYTLTVSNSGGPASGIVISDALPLGSSFVGCGGGLCAQNEGVVTWSGLHLPANDELEVTLTVSACAGPLVNRAFRVAGSNEGVSSPWGTPITSSVSAPNLVAAWQVSSDILPINAALTLTSASSTDGSPIVAWTWDFGDGSQASGSVVSHSYTSAGSYTLTLTISDTCGYSQSVVAPNAIQVQSKFWVFLPVVLRNY